MITGTVFGVVLNDRAEIASLGDGLSADPYKAPPVSPVVYIKPRGCLASGGAPVRFPDNAPELTLSPTLGLLFSSDVSSAAVDPLSHIGGACLAIDVSLRELNYYRPAVRERCRDSFLPVGQFVPFSSSFASLEIRTSINGVSAHAWSLERLVRPVDQLITDLTSFMSFSAGDLLLVGLPGDAPSATLGAQISIDATGLPSLRTELCREQAA